MHGLNCAPLALMHILKPYTTVYLYAEGGPLGGVRVRGGRQGGSLLHRTGVLIRGGTDTTVLFPHRNREQAM